MIGMANNDWSFILMKVKSMIHDSELNLTITNKNNKNVEKTEEIDLQMNIKTKLVRMLSEANGLTIQTTLI